jgi:hypothetical protein
MTSARCPNNRSMPYRGVIRHLSSVYGASPDEFA